MAALPPIVWCYHLRPRPMLMQSQAVLLQTTPQPILGQRTITDRTTRMALRLKSCKMFNSYGLYKDKYMQRANNMLPQ